MRFGAVGFDHGHIAEQLRIALAHPEVEVVAVHHGDRGRMDAVAEEVGVPPALRYDDFDSFWAQRPEIVLVCSTTAEHADWVDRIAAAGGAHVLLEKPFAISVADAQRMIAAQDSTGHALAVNWPLAFYPVHRTAQRLIADGAIGEVRELQYYDGNRGPFRWADPADPGQAWWFDVTQGGGSLQDYLGYGTTLATWFLDGEAPARVTAVQHAHPRHPIDTHSVVVAEYGWGLGVFQTRWGTISDPWLQQPVPRTGFVVVGTEGALASYDYRPVVHLRNDAHPDGTDLPVDIAGPDVATALATLVTALREGDPIPGPTSAEVSLTGQRIVDAAVESARTGRPVELEVPA